MNARLAHRLTGWKIDIVSDTEFAQQEAEAAFGGDERRGGRLLRPLLGGALERQALPERGAARLEVLRRAGPPGARAARARRRGRTRSSRSPSRSSRRSPTRPSPRRSPRTPPSSATPSREEFPAGPGDAPVAGEDETLESGGPHAVRVEDDPDDGIPIVHVTPEEAEEVGETADPIRTCAGCGRKAPQARAPALPRSATARSWPAPGAGRGVYTCRRLACFERARAHRGFNRTLRRTVRVDPDRSRGSTLERR